MRAAAAHTTMAPMNLRNILSRRVIGLVLVGYASAGWPGVAAVVGGLVMWALLHFTRLMNVMKKAANRPMGYVGSAVMLNARLKTRREPDARDGHDVIAGRPVGGKRPARGVPLDGRNPIARDLRICERQPLQKWTLERPQAEAEAE